MIPPFLPCRSRILFTTSSYFADVMLLVVNACSPACSRAPAGGIAAVRRDPNEFLSRNVRSVIDLLYIWSYNHMIHFCLSQEILGFMDFSSQSLANHRENVDHWSASAHLDTRKTMENPSTLAGHDVVGEQARRSCAASGRPRQLFETTIVIMYPLYLRVNKPLYSSNQPKGKGHLQVEIGGSEQKNYMKRHDGARILRVNMANLNFPTCFCSLYINFNLAHKHVPRQPRWDPKLLPVCLLSAG